MGERRFGEGGASDLERVGQVIWRGGLERGIGDLAKSNRKT